MDYREAIESYRPINEQEEEDQSVILEYINKDSDLILTRKQRIAHISSSSIILNKDFSQMLMIYHRIYDTWTWTGGHADGEKDLLQLALREAYEETGLQSISPFSEHIGALDILTVEGHIKKGKYVAPHLHLNVSYVFVGDDTLPLTLNEEETMGVKWVPKEEVAAASKEPAITYIFDKLYRFMNR